MQQFDGAALFSELSERGIRHVVVGGFAVIAHGVIRTTKDLDICPNPDHAYPLLAADAVEGTVAGIHVRVASLDNLRRMKQAAGRPQDLEDLRQLDLAHGAPPG